MNGDIDFPSRRRRQHPIAPPAALAGSVDGDLLRSLLVGEQPPDVDVERLGDFQRHRNRRCALAALDLGQVALGQSGLLGEGLQGQSALPADGAQ